MVIRIDVSRLKLWLYILNVYYKDQSPGTNDHIFYMGKTNSPCKFSNLGREHISKEVFQNFLNNIFT